MTIVSNWYVTFSPAFLTVNFVFRTSIMGSNSHPGTATRSLPEIPVDAAKTTSTSAVINSATSNFVSYIADTNSDLYATLEEHKISKFVFRFSKI